MVTAELAFAALALGALLVWAWWAVGLLVTQIRCVDGAAEIARQAARGDRAAAGKAQERLPAGASVSVRTEGGLVVVRAAVDVPTPIGPLGPFQISVEQSALAEKVIG